MEGISKVAGGLAFQNWEKKKGLENPNYSGPHRGGIKEKRVCQCVGKDRLLASGASSWGEGGNGRAAENSLDLGKIIY